MEISGKIIVATEPRTGTSARTGSKWVAQDFVIETHEQYPKRCVFGVFGEDRLREFNINVGDELTVSFDIDAHEYNGRWFNSVRAFNVEKSGQQGAQQPIPQAPINAGKPQAVAQAPQQAPQQQQLFNGGTPNMDIDQLPF